MKTNPRSYLCCVRGLFLSWGAALMVSSALAVPYASQVIKNGNTVSFVLNHPAAGITVLRDGGNPVTPALARIFHQSGARRI